MSERTIILSTHREELKSGPTTWAGELGALLIRKFDALITQITKWTNF